MTEGLLTPEEIAKYLHLSISTLQRWRQVEGKGPLFVKLSHTCVRYRRRDVDAWIEERLILDPTTEETVE